MRAFVPGSIYPIRKLSATPNTEKEIQQVKRVVAGARGCKDAKHAAEVLDMLGLLDPKKPNG